MSGVRCLAALGDSFTAGGPDGATWVDELAGMLGAAEFHNLAVNGARTSAVAGEQLHLVLALRPDVVTLVCGANDVLFSTRPPVEAYEAGLIAMVTRLRAGLPDAALATATMPDFSRFMELRERTRARVGAGLAALNAATRRVAAQHHMLCVDLEDHPGASHRASFATDGYHASAAAQSRIARAFARVLAEHLSISPRSAQEVA